VHFKIVEADTEKDNVKAASGNDRRFFLHGDEPVTEEGGELVIRFEYGPDGDKRKQDAINADTAKRVIEDLNAETLAVWQHRLSAKWKRADGTETDRTVLEKHLYDYTRRNTFDYFIHKDLRGFLRRELDFYIKNEVMRLDDVEEESAPRVEQYLSKIKVIRRIAHKIIDFLAQIENFQKKLWLKKKFVVETNYCVTLDRVPEGLFPDIAANDAQREEWVRLFAIDGIKGNLHTPKYTKPLTATFLKANPFLVLDTKHFSQEFKERLLAGVEDVGARCEGVLVRSENYSALRFVAEKHTKGVDCVYIDPPYNSKTTRILYKNDYQHSSWASLMDNRLRVSAHLTTATGSHVVAIDENEQELLGYVLSARFPGHTKICVSVIHNKKGIQGDYFSYNHEFAYFCIPAALSQTHGRRIPSDKWDFANLRKWGRESERSTARNCFYPIVVRNGEISRFGDVCDEDFHPGNANIRLKDDAVAIYPVDTKGVERKWRYARKSVENIRHLLKVHTTASGEMQIHKAKEEKQFKTVWDSSTYIAGDYGTKWLTDLGLKISEDLYPKSIHTVKDSVSAVTEGDAVVLDYFAGSGTTGHAVIDLNREDNGNRKYILVEMADYFDTVLVPRIKKVVYSKDWKNGKPVSRQGVSHMFKYIRLESYEDALANIRLGRTEAQQMLLDKAEGFRESYMLGYMLETESKGSPSLLNIDWFDDPWSYTLAVGTGSVGETKPVNVDLVETFNWLLGLKVKHIDRIGGFQVIEGTNPTGEKVLVIWRKIRDLTAEGAESAEEIQKERAAANTRLEAFFKKQHYNTLDSEFDVIYVNGDNNLMNVPLEPEKEGVQPRYKVRLIEEEFKRLMFDVKDI